MSWEILKIEDFADVIGGGTPSTKNSTYWNGDIPWIGPRDLSKWNFKFIERGERNISNLGLEKSSAKLLPVKTVLMTSRAPIGYVAIAKNEICTNQGFQNLVCKENIANPNFVYYLIKEHIDKIKAVASGATFPEISKTKLKGIELPIPPLQTQKRIADILSAYDDLIENNLKRIKLLEQAAQNIYKEWFVNLRFPGHENTPINEETGLPDGWEEKEISTIITFLGGYAFKSKTYIENGKYRVITIKNVGDKVFNASVGNSVSIIPEKMKEHCKIIEGDILLSLTGNVGRSCIAYGENNLLNQRVAKIEPINTRWRPYIYWMFNDNKIFSLMNNLATGAAQQNLSPVKLAKEKVVIPSESFIDLYCLKANSFFKQIILLNKQNQKLKAARDILLPRLMNRTIEV